MKSINYQLRTAYKSAIESATGKNVYYPVAPESETGTCYITLNQVGSTDVSTKSSADTKTQIMVQIHTWAQAANAGKVADDTATQVYQAIFLTTQSNVSVTGAQVVSTKMVSDTVDELTGLDNRVFITRRIMFEHNILHN